MQEGLHATATRESVVVAYILANFSDFQNLEVTERIKIRCICELFVQGMIFGEQLTNIARMFYPTIHRAVQILINSVLSPVTTFPRHRMSMIEQNTLLLASYQTRFWESVCSFVGKTVPQCMDRRRYVIRCLNNSGLLIDTPQPKQRLLSIVHLELCNVAPRTGTDSAILKAQIMRIKSQAKKEIMRMRMCNVRLHRQTKNLQKIIDQAAAENCSDEDEDTEQSLPITEQGHSIWEELSEWRERPGRGRNYPDNLLSLSQLLALTSRKTYLILRQVFPLPSLACLKNHYSAKLAVIKEQLSGFGLIDEHISKLVGSFGKSPPPVTLAVDAFAFQTFYETSPLRNSCQTMRYSNAFIFMCIPLDSRARPTVVHLMIKENGSFDAQVMAKLREIVELYQRGKVTVLFTATDGDPFLHASHNTFFQEHVQQYQADYFFLIGDIYRKLLEVMEPMPIADPLHFAKNLRGKLLDHNVAIIASESPVFTNATVLKSVLKDLGPTLDDVSRLGRMRDFYATSLFTMNNVCRLMAANQYHSAFLLLPYACIFAILYAKTWRQKQGSF